MKHSLKIRILVYFILLMAAALVAIGVFHVIFIDDIYVNKQKAQLEESYALANEIGDDYEDIELKRYCSMNGFTYILADADLTRAVSNTNLNDRLINRLFMKILDNDKENMKTLASNEKYEVLFAHDEAVNVDYIELWGTVDDGRYYLVQAPLYSIREAASLSNMIYIYIGIVALAGSLVVIWLITGKLMKPVNELTELSQRMADLDFEAKYESGGQDEIGRLGENFNVMSEKLEETISELKSANARLEKDIEEKVQIDEMRREFLSNVSHELKTPIALVQGYAEVLKEMQMDEESRIYYCDVIIDESVKMNRLVRSLLSLNELESGMGRLDLKRFDIMALIRGVVSANMLSIENRQARINVSPEGPVYVWGDEFQIEQVVTNYLTNAINYVSGEMLIDITVKTEGDKVITTVFNTGDPIPEDSIEHVWDKLYKADKARTREYGGNGIGLSIVKAIMDLHRQECSVENTADGVAFSFALESR